MIFRRICECFAVFFLFCRIALPSTPTVNPVSPTGSAGAGQVFTFTFSDSAGYQDLGVLNVLINSALDGRQACYLAYSQPANVLYLVTDDGVGLVGLPLNGAGSVANSQCTISGLGSSAVGHGANLALTLSISFKSAFAGDRIIYAAGRDVVGNNSGADPRGLPRIDVGIFVSDGAQLCANIRVGEWPLHRNLSRRHLARQHSQRADFDQ